MSTKLQPAVLRWARKRSELSLDSLSARLKLPVSDIEQWEVSGEIDSAVVPKLAKATHTPLGSLFLQQPPVLKLPIADFRRLPSDETEKPVSVNLLDVVNDCLYRQRWYREYQIEQGAKPLPFVGSATVSSPLIETAQHISHTLQIGPAIAAEAATWEQAVGRTIEAIEDGGIIVIRSGIVGNYTKRQLSVDEFRGFALSDPYAPLVFVNGVDATAAQIFTLIHEVAHIWINQSAVSNFDELYPASGAVEAYCNGVAAEVLVPMSALKSAWRKNEPPGAEIRRLSDQFKVSKLVIARRARDAGHLSSSQYSAFYKSESAKSRRAGGGNYYLTAPYKNSRRFSSSLILDTRDGRTQYHEAMRMLGMRKDSTFRRYAEELGITL